MLHWQRQLSKSNQNPCVIKIFMRECGKCLKAGVVKAQTEHATRESFPTETIHRALQLPHLCTILVLIAQAAAVADGALI